MINIWPIGGDKFQNLPPLSPGHVTDFMSARTASRQPPKLAKEPICVSFRVKCGAKV